MIKVLELFAGYGSQALALKRMGLEYESRISEIDKYAIQAYNLIHGETFNYGDICQIDEKKLPYFDLITYSSPCQDFSIAGKQRGGEKDSGTRSSLLWECERIIRAVKPKYLLMENVKNLVGKKFKPCFCAWLKTLESLGYSNFWKVLNAKDYGVPQNRERVFVVSVLNGGQYLFPQKKELKRKLLDVLEKDVEEKYFLSAEQSDNVLKWFKQKDVSNALRIGGASSMDKKHCFDLVQIGNIRQSDSFDNPTRGRVYSAAGISPCLNTMQGGQSQPYVSCLSPKRTEYGKAIRKDYESGKIKESRHNFTELEPRNDGITNTLTSVQKDNLICVGLKIPANTKKGYEIASVGDSINLAFPKSENRRGRVEYGVAQTLQTTNEQVVLDVGVGHNPISKKFEFDGFNDKESPALIATDYKCPKCFSDGVRIRKLTPRECWRLMGVDDADFDKVQGKISNTQLYKLAGNSIVVDVLADIFRNIFINKEEKGQLTLL